MLVEITLPPANGSAELKAAKADSSEAAAAAEQVSVHCPSLNSAAAAPRLSPTGSDDSDTARLEGHEASWARPAQGLHSSESFRLAGGVRAWSRAEPWPLVGSSDGAGCRLGPARRNPPRRVATPRAPALRLRARISDSGPPQVTGAQRRR